MSCKRPCREKIFLVMHSTRGSVVSLVLVGVRGTVILLVSSGVMMQLFLVYTACRLHQLRSNRVFADIGTVSLMLWLAEAARSE